MEKDKIYLIVLSREGVVFEGNVSSVTSYNDLGIFDILSHHANFISLINKGLVIKNLGDKDKEIKFDNALMKVYKDVVEVYVGVEGMAPSKLRQSEYTSDNINNMHT